MMSVMSIPFAIIAWSIYLLPRKSQLFWGRLIGAILYRKGARRSVIDQNLAIAFPKSEQAPIRETLARAAYTHLGNLALEILFLFGPMPLFVRKYCRLDGAENWSRARAQGRGIIFVSSHVGNWEVMSASGALLSGIDLMIVTKRLKPAWLHRAIERGRSRAGVLGTYEPRTMSRTQASLKKRNRRIRHGSVLRSSSGGTCSRFWSSDGNSCCDCNAREADGRGGSSGRELQNSRRALRHGYTPSSFVEKQRGPAVGDR